MTSSSDGHSGSVVAMAAAPDDAATGPASASPSHLSALPSAPTASLPRPTTPSTPNSKPPTPSDGPPYHQATADPSAADTTTLNATSITTDSHQDLLPPSQAQPQPLPNHHHQLTDTHPPPPPPVTSPFTPGPPALASLGQHAYMMMALASLSGNPSTAMSPPPTVTPSQVTLPRLVDDSLNGISPPNLLRQPTTDKGLESFARIEFADSVFQMTTYAVIIGRDQRALEQARRDERRAEEHRRLTEDNANRGLPPPLPIHHDRSKFSKSYVSEEGGMLGPESDSGGDNCRPAKRRKTSTAGSSQNDAQDPPENVISNRQYISHTPGAAAVDLASLRPSPWHVPFIGIHSPGPNIASKTKAISREHLKIAYNQQDGVFEAIPLHKNGFFCEDVHYKLDKVVLRSGDRLQIKDVDFRFIINGVPTGRSGAEEEAAEDEAAKVTQRRGGKEMSFDFERSHNAKEMRDTSEDLSDLDASPPDLSDFGDEDEADPDGDDPESVAATAAAAAAAAAVATAATAAATAAAALTPAALDSSAMPQPIPKKRGPGRPPKNGIMSKREQRLLKKQQQEMAKKTLPPPPPPVEPPVKRKVGRPRKHPLPENGGERPEKRKYKPRKPKTEDGAEGSEAERRAREKKEKKARPKSPPLELKIGDYSEEQLQKPNKNYGVLIDETLTAAGPSGLTLKQIYKRICQRYPWYYFHTETKGWESSVRHNLIGNEAFRKDETTNMWSRVPGIELDAGKKRKASSPDRGLAPQSYAAYPYTFGAPTSSSSTTTPSSLPLAAAAAAAASAPGVYPAAGPAPLPTAYRSPGFSAGRPMQPYTDGQPHSSTAPKMPPPPAPPPVPGYGPPPAPARPPSGASQPGAYSSPYASRPPPPPPPPPPPALAASAANKVEMAATSEGATARLQPQQQQGVPRQQQPPLQHQQQQQQQQQTLQQQQQQHQHQHQQHHHQPASTSSRPAAGDAARGLAPSTPARPVIDPLLLAAVVNLKNGLVENLRKAHNPKAEAIVMSALNRCIGLKKGATENAKMESICIKGIRQVVDGFAGRISPPADEAADADDSPAPMLEAFILESLNGFKQVSVLALKSRVSEAWAEALPLSAIDRVLGLAEASTVPCEAESEPGQGALLESLEQHMMKSLRQMLRGMNQKLQEP